MSTDALKNIRLKDNGSGEGGLFIRFVAGEPRKVRVFSLNPLVANDQFENTRYNMAVWDFTEAKPMILSAGATIIRGISELHNDEDFGADVSKVDIKITPTGEKMERRYTLSVLPKAASLTPEDTAKVQELDKDLEKFVKNGIRAEEYNNGGELPDVVAEANEELDAELLSQMPPSWLDREE